MRSSLSAAVLFLLVSLVPANADTKVPDLKGTWIGKAEGVVVNSPEAAAKPHWGYVDVVLKIIAQRDRRFSGTMQIKDQNKPIAGVVAFDGAVWWAESDGFVQGRLRDADTIEACYVRASAERQQAACEVLKRQK